MGFPGGASDKEPTCKCRRCKRCKFDPTYPQGSMRDGEYTNSLWICLIKANINTKGCGGPPCWLSTIPLLYKKKRVQFPIVQYSLLATRKTHPTLLVLPGDEACSAVSSQLLGSGALFAPSLDLTGRCFVLRSN